MGFSTKKQEKKEDGRNSLKASTGHNTNCEKPKKKIIKTSSETSDTTKSLSTVTAAKCTPKLRSVTETPAEKLSPNSASKALAAAATTKKSVTKGGEIKNSRRINCKYEPGPTKSSKHVAAPKAPGFGDQVIRSTESKNQEGEEELQICAKLKLSDTSVPTENKVISDLSDDRRQIIEKDASESPNSIIRSHISEVQTRVVSFPNSQKGKASPADRPCNVVSTTTPLEDSLSGIHPQVSPESETGSTHTTSSDDIKPRSEDYDAGGSQDDDFSHERGVSKCGTMQCHDFLGRSSSDTSTPEELNVCEGRPGLRVEVWLHGREVETTSEEDTERCHRRSWLVRDEVCFAKETSEPELSAGVKRVPDHQLFSSEDEENEDNEEESEDERSAVEVTPSQVLMAPVDPSLQSLGIVNLAFDDDILDHEKSQLENQPNSKIHRSLLLSVDECEEICAEEGNVQTPTQKPEDASSHCDVPPRDQQNHFQKSNDIQNEEGRCEKSHVFLPELQESVQVKGEYTKEDTGNSSIINYTRDLPPQERPCQLDLRHAEQYKGGPQSIHVKLSENKKDDFHLVLNELKRNTTLPASQHPPGNV